jgi:WhiB family redox-sensing transcriptional regulator
MSARDDAVSAVVARLRRLRGVDDDALGAAIRRAAACLEPQEDGQAPGWLHDEDTAPDLAVRLCAGCPVRDECTELELRLAGDRSVGMWGAYGEHGRQALHRLWKAANAADAAADNVAAERVPGDTIGGRDDDRG